MRIGSNSCWDFVKDNIAFFFTSIVQLDSTLCGDRFITLSVIRWALLNSPFAIVSEIIDAFVSSTYFRKRAFSVTRSLINMKKLRP